MVKLEDIGRAIYWGLPSVVTKNIQALRDEGVSGKKIFRTYFNESKSIYIHIPKVAGKSISYALYGNDPKHHKLSSFESLDKSKFDCYFKFGFVRNPWSRLYSTYKYLQNQNSEYPYGPFYWMTRYNSFENFVMSGLTSKVIEKHLFLNTQHSYLTNLSGDIAVDFVGRFESIDEDFKSVVEQTGLKGELQVIGASSDRNKYQQVYTDAMKNKVGELYSVDVLCFGYDF